MSVKVHEAYCLDSTQDRLLWFDDFLGDQLQDEWRVFGGGASWNVIDQQTGGIVRLTTAIALNSQSRIDWNDIRSLHVDKKVSFECRVKLSDGDGTKINVDLALYFDANNRIFFNNASTDTWNIRTIDGGAGTSVSSGVSVDAIYHIFRIECFPAGEVHFFIDGVETANSPITTNIPDDAGDYLQPFFEVQTKEDGVSKYIDVDYVALRQEI